MAPTPPVEPVPPREPVPPVEPVLPVEPRQRWRLTFGRGPVAADQVGRAVLEAWQDSLVASGLPIVGLESGGGGHARIAFAAPLAAAASGEAELVDLWLLERRPLWAVREALGGRLPAAHRWISAEDVWLGEPALAGRVSAADWRIELRGPDGLDRAPIAEAVQRLLAAHSLPRIRRKGTTEKPYDLRVLLEDVTVEPGAEGRAATAGPIVLCVRTKFHPELGAGRPEEVVAALAESLGVAIEVAGLVRVRLLLGDAPPARVRPTGLSRR